MFWLCLYLHIFISSLVLKVSFPGKWSPVVSCFPPSFCRRSLRSKEGPARWPLICQVQPLSLREANKSNDGKTKHMTGDPIMGILCVILCVITKSLEKSLIGMRNGHHKESLRPLSVQ